MHPNWQTLGQKFKKLHESTGVLGKSGTSAGNAVYEAIAADLDSLSESLSKDGELLRERLSRLEVPLPTFNVSEFNTGDNITKVHGRFSSPQTTKLWPDFLPAEWKRSTRKASWPPVVR